MTMHISRKQEIAGIAAFELRRALRRLAAWNREQFTVEMLADVLKIDEGMAGPIAAQLAAEGYLQRVEPKDNEKQFKGPWYQFTDKGHSLASASAAKRIKRATADKLIEELLERARCVNAPASPYSGCIQSLVLFGSHLGVTEDLGDVDIAVELRKRYEDPDEQERAEHARIDEAKTRGRVFHNTLEEVFWPDQEIYLVLRSRRRGISLHAISDLQNIFRQKGPVLYKVIFGELKTALADGA